MILSVSHDKNRFVELNNETLNYNRFLCICLQTISESVDSLCRDETDAPIT